jgi:hypothetical protein
VIGGTRCRPLRIRHSRELHIERKILKRSHKTREKANTTPHQPPESLWFLSEKRSKNQENEQQQHTLSPLIAIIIIMAPPHFSIHTVPIPKEYELMDRYWKASNYLAVGQVRLVPNGM